ncbi:putative ubiquitin carboxyl-terminal hydrolase MINDY-4 [Nymphon striatum]|nr:putative ubiquitin carboxyl-terminal hydrolase MINDY-4 [Nymphon striatum]
MGGHCSAVGQWQYGADDDDQQNAIDFINIIIPVQCLGPQLAWIPRGTRDILIQIQEVASRAIDASYERFAMDLDHDYTKELTASIVREYLSRKGLKDTISVFEKELPRTSLSISSRTALIKSLHLKHQIKENKESSNPFGAILEVLIDCYIQKNKRAEGVNNFISKSDKNQIESNKRSVQPNLGLLDEKLAKNSSKFSNMNHQKKKDCSGEENNTVYGVETHDAAPVRRSHRTKLIQKEITRELEKKKPDCNMKPERQISHPEIETKAASKEVLAVTSTAAVSSSASKTSEKTDSSETKRKNKSVKKFNDLELEDLEDFESEGIVGSSELSLQNDQKYQSFSLPITLKQATEIRHLLFGSESTTFSYEWMKQDFSFNNISKLYYGLVQYRGGPCGILAAIQAYTIKYLFFCAEKIQSDDISSKCDEALIQAIAHILWKAGENKACFLALPSAKRKFTIAGKFKSDGLLEYNLPAVLTFVDFSKAFDSIHRAKLMEIMEAYGIPPTIIKAVKILYEDTEARVSIYEFTKHSDLLSCLKDNLVEIQSGKSGCVLILYSGHSFQRNRKIWANGLAALRESLVGQRLREIKSDMDDPNNNLIGAHGYCSQEMVNLLLTGKASSNVFNDVIELDSGACEKSILKGIFNRSEIGFLSLFEHYNSCEVGSYFKSPIYPIWVVCSESHFSVIFGRNQKLVGCQSDKFDLYYYDGFAQQDDEIKLTVDPKKPPSYSDLVPPLDDCIRTKWKHASVDWNGFEPIL